MRSKLRKPGSYAGLQGVHALPPVESDGKPLEALPTLHRQTGTWRASTLSNAAKPFLLQIDNVLSCPVYVKKLQPRRKPSFLVTPDRALAMTFSHENAHVLAMVAAEVATWPLEPTSFRYVLRVIP